MKIPPSRWHFLCSKHDILYPASYEFGQNDCTIAMTTINPNTTRMSNTTTPNMRSDFFSCWHRGISCRTWRQSKIEATIKSIITSANTRSTHSAAPKVLFTFMDKQNHARNIQVSSATTIFQGVLERKPGGANCIWFAEVPGSFCV